MEYKDPAVEERVEQIVKENCVTDSQSPWQYLPLRQLVDARFQNRTSQCSPYLMGMSQSSKHSLKRIK